MHNNKLVLDGSSSTSKVMKNRILYPTRSDYDTVVRSLSSFTNEPSLRKSSLSYQEDGIFPLIYSGGRAIVYKLKIEGVDKAMKLWVQDLAELSTRYKHVSEFILKTSKKYLVNTQYLDQEILVNGIRYPLLLMDWVQEQNLKDWLSENASDSRLMTAVLDSLHALADDMIQENISHGDLQHNNILVDCSGDIILVDYDSLYVPGLDNLSVEIKGLPGYQHPTRKQVKLANAHADSFSHISIYLSLRTLKESPDLFRYCEDLDQLLIGSTDIENPAASTILANIKTIAGMEGLVNSFIDICTISDFKDIPTLDEFIVRSSPTSATSRQKSRLQKDMNNSLESGNTNFEWNFTTLRNDSVNTVKNILDANSDEIADRSDNAFSWTFDTKGGQRQLQTRQARKDRESGSNSVHSIFEDCISEESGGRSYQDAWVKYMRADYSGALESLQRSKLAAGSGKNAMKSLLRALIRLELNDFEGSIGDINHCIGKLVDPSYQCRAYVVRADAQFELGDYISSIQDYGMALSINMGMPAVYIRRGNAKFYSEDFIGALEDFTKAIAIDPEINDPEYYNLRGGSKYHLGDYIGAISDYSQAIEIGPCEPDYYANRGVAMNSLSDYKSSIADHDQAIRLDSDNAWYYTERGNSKLRLGLLEEAITDLAKALELDPEDHESMVALQEAKQALQDLAIPAKSEQPNSESAISATARKSLLSKLMKRILSD